MVRAPRGPVLTFPGRFWRGDHARCAGGADVPDPLRAPPHTTYRPAVATSSPVSLRTPAPFWGLGRSRATVITEVSAVWSGIEHEYHDDWLRKILR